MIEVKLLSQAMIDDKAVFKLEQTFPIQEYNDVNVYLEHCTSPVAAHVAAGRAKMLKILAIKVPEEFEGKLSFALEENAKDWIDLADSKLYTGSALEELLTGKDDLDIIYFSREDGDSVKVTVFYGRDVTEQKEDPATGYSKGSVDTSSS